MADFQPPTNKNREKRGWASKASTKTLSFCFQTEISLINKKKSFLSFSFHVSQNFELLECLSLSALDAFIRQRVKLLKQLNVQQFKVTNFYYFCFSTQQKWYISLKDLKYRENDKILLVLSRKSKGQDLEMGAIFLNLSFSFRFLNLNGFVGFQFDRDLDAVLMSLIWQCPILVLAIVSKLPNET